MPFSQLLSEADTALQAARQLGPNRCEILPVGQSHLEAVKGRTWWKNTLNTVLDNGEIRLLGQSVAMSRQREKILHTEVLSRVALDSETLISAGVFIPLAERLHLISRLDRQVMEKVLKLVAERWSGGNLAVNISPTSLEDPTFLRWLLKTLKSLPSGGPRLVFEFVEFSAIQHLETVRKFSTSAKQLGHAIGLDHFGQSFANFGYLKSLQPEYVKIDRAYISELAAEHSSDSQFFIGALCSAAHSLDILVIAEGVEAESQCKVLSDLNIDALQGYLISQPEKLSR